MKRSENERTSVRQSFFFFFFFKLPQNVLRRRCCVAKLRSRVAGGGVTLHGLLLGEGELGPGARGLLVAGVGVHGLVGGWLLIGVLRQEGDGRVGRSRLGLGVGFHVGDALIAHVLSRVQHPLWTPPRVLWGRWGMRRWRGGRKKTVTVSVLRGPFNQPQVTPPAFQMKPWRWNTAAMLATSHSSQWNSVKLSLPLSASLWIFSFTNMMFWFPLLDCS